MPHKIGHRESTGAKRWLEENLSKKGISRAYNKASAYQAGEMSKEVIPGLSQGDLYGMVTGGVTGKASSLKGIYKAGKSMFSKWKGGKSVASTIAKTSQVSKPRPVSAVHHSGKEIGKVKDVYPQTVFNPASTSRKTGATRDVAMVKMTNKGKDWWQPFYKSSGGSGVKEADILAGKLAGRKGKWEPFLGKTTSGVRHTTYADPSTGGSVGAHGQGWFQKGWFQEPGGVKGGAHRWQGSSGKKYIKSGMSEDAADIAQRTGPYGKVSQELSRLEKGGFFDKPGLGKLDLSKSDWKSENPFLKSFGLDRPKSYERSWHPQSSKRKSS